MAQYTPSAIKPPSGALADDGDFETTRPRICVDYLSHQWQEEDVWRSWRSMTRFKYQIANGMRLENASWRTWWKQRNKLQTISPETLNWLKDSDVTWLYGPLHQAPADPPTKISSVQDKFGIDAPKPMRRKEEESPPPNPASFQAKPILKRRSITDILAMAIVPPRNPQSHSSPIYESVSVELEANAEEEEGMVMESESTLPPAAGVLQASSRPTLWHTKSDSIIVRQRMGATLSTSPMSIHGLTPPGEGAVAELSKSSSLSPPEYGRPRNGHRSDSSSSYQVSDDSGAGRHKPKRHISFNSFVEQRIVVEPTPIRLSTVYARSSSESGSDEEDEDTILQMRSSSGSSISSGRSGRRGSSNSGTSLSDTPTTAKIAPHMTMITAPIAPTLLKDPDNLPAPSPAVVFVAPQGVDEETLKYEVHIASRPQFAVQADRRRAGSTDWSPNDGTDWYEQSEMADYFANVPLSTPAEPDREPIYTDEDDDAITVRRRKGGLRSPRSSEAGIRQESSPPETKQPLPRKSSLARKSHQGGSSSPTVTHQEVARSMARYGVNIKDTSDSKPPIVPRRAGSSSDLMEPSRWSSPNNGGIVGSAPRSSHLSASMSSMRSSAGGRNGNRNRPRGASFEGVDLGGHTSALSGRSGSSSTSGTGDELVKSQTAALFSPPREADLADTRGRSQRISEEGERPRRGRSLLRTGSSSTISERERSSTTGSSSSPIGSLSPRSNSSVGIVGGYIVPPTGIGAIIVPPSGSLRSGSGLRFEAGSWSVEEERRVDGGDLAQVAAPQSKPPSGGGLVRTSSSSNIPAQTSLQSSTRSSGIRRSSSSTSIATKPTVLQRTSSSSNIAGTARQSPQLVTSPMNNVPTLTLQPSSRRTSLSEIGGRGTGTEYIPLEDSLASNPGSLGSHSLESTGSFWYANELALESPATPLSPAASPHLSTNGNIEETSLHRDLLNKGSVKPRASGLSLASNASGGSNSSTTTVVPTQAVNVKRRNAPLASASSSISSNTSTPPGHRRSGSKSSLSTAAPPTPPSAMRSNSSSSIATRHVTQTVATRSEVGSPSTESEKQLRRLSGGISSSIEERASSTYSSPPVSPSFVLSNVVGSAKGLFGAIWGSDHSG